MDEKGINMTHTSPYVGSIQIRFQLPIEILPKNVSTTIMIGCDNTLGQNIPPFFILAIGSRKSNSPQPEPLGVGNLLTSSENFSESETEHDEKCVCGLFQPVK